MGRAAAFLTAPGLTPPKTTGVTFRMVIDKNDTHVFAIRDGKAEEMGTDFHLTRLLTNALVVAINSGKDKDGTWVETWAFVPTLMDADTLNAVWTRQINNVNLPLNAKDSKFTKVATGELKRLK